MQTKSESRWPDCFLASVPLETHREAYFLSGPRLQNRQSFSVEDKLCHCRDSPRISGLVRGCSAVNAEVASRWLVGAQKLLVQSTAARLMRSAGMPSARTRRGSNEHI